MLLRRAGKFFGGRTDDIKVKTIALYIGLQVIVIVIFFVYFNVTKELFGYSFTRFDAWIFYLLICLFLYCVYRFPLQILTFKYAFSQWVRLKFISFAQSRLHVSVRYRPTGVFTKRELTFALLGSFLPFFTTFTLLMALSTGLADECIINSHVVEIRRTNYYYTYNSDSVPKCNVYHPDYYRIYAADGKVISVSAGEYSNLYGQLGTSEKLIASSQYGQCSGDGREYSVKWSGRDEDLIPCAYGQLYINYVKATESIHRVSGQADLPVVDYPWLQNSKYGRIDIDRVIGDRKESEAWEKVVDDQIARELVVLGPKRQCNILVYLTDQSEAIFHSIREKWIGGKKNDIIVVIGGSVASPSWVRVLCWSLDATFEVKLRDAILNNQNNSNPLSFVKTIVEYVDHPTAGYQRKPMANYRYLLSEVHLKWWAWLWVLSIMFVILYPLLVLFYNN